jgi:K+-sensing histidine kinase KdpD
MRYNEMMLKKEISFAFSATKLTVAVSGVRRDIRELFDILFDNAIKYCPQGGAIRMVIPSPSENAELTLFNTVLGDSEIQTAEIFKPFVRKESERIPGYGLGLAIADKIVKNHRGSIRAEKEKKGIIFVVDFPAQKVHS